MTLLLVDDRSTFTAEHDERYLLGPTGAPLLTLNAVDGDGCAWIAEVEGWHAPTVATPLDRRPNGHGGYVGASSFDPLTLTVEGSVAAPTRAALRAARDRLLDALLGDLTGFLRYTHADDAPAKGVWARIVGQPKWREPDDRYAEFAFVLLAEDPIKTGDPITVGPIRLPTPGGDGGYPQGATGAVAPWTATGGGAAAGPSVGTVPNVGNEAAHATYRITGPLAEPIVQVTTGEYVHLRLTLGDADEAVVDTADGTVQVNGVNRYDAWGPGSTFPLIPPGGAEVRLLSYTGGDSPAAGLTVITAPSWR